jgi:hypothetical protein
VEPLVTTGLSDKNLPVDKVTTFLVSGGSIYFFVIYDNFKKGEPITVSWVYLENGKEVTSVKQEAGGDFGRFIVEFQKPDTGWGKGKQRITVTGNGATATVDFAIGDTLATTPLPYDPAAGTGSSSESGIPDMTPVSPGVVGTNSVRNTDTRVSQREESVVSSSGNARLSGNPGMATIVTTQAAMIAYPGPCPNGQTMCNGKCTDLKKDIRNCGACGTICKAGYPHSNPVCGENGTCTIECDSGYIKHGNLCYLESVFTSLSGYSSSSSCNPGSGQLSIEDAITKNWVSCDGHCTNPYNDAENCGGCGKKCPMEVHMCIGGYTCCMPDKGCLPPQ